MLWAVKNFEWKYHRNMLMVSFSGRGRNYNTWPFWDSLTEAPRFAAHSKNLVIAYFTFTAIRSADKFSNKQQLLGLNVSPEQSGILHNSIFHGIVWGNMIMINNLRSLLYPTGPFSVLMLSIGEMISGPRVYTYILFLSWP